MISWKLNFLRFNKYCKDVIKAVIIAQMKSHSDVIAVLLFADCDLIAFSSWL